MIRHLYKYISGDIPEFDVRRSILVIIVNYNGKAFINTCTYLLSKQTHSEFNALIIDNNSTDDSKNTVVLPDDRFKLLSLNENIGFAAANNLAAHLYPSEFIATLNPDAFPKQDWLEQLYKRIRMNRDCAAVGSTQIYYNDTRLLDGSGDAFFFAGFPYRGGYRQPSALSGIPAGETFSACAAAALYNTEIFKSSGGFDEKFFCYCEDVDLGFRFRLYGYTSFQAPEAVVLHIEGGCSEKSSGFSEYMSHRNALWVHIKNMPALMLVFSVPAYLSIELMFILRMFVEISRIPENTRAVKLRSRAAIHALRELPSMLRSRRVIQAGRKISAVAVGRCLTWSPRKFFSRKINLDTGCRAIIR